MFSYMFSSLPEDLVGFFCVNIVKHLELLKGQAIIIIIIQHLGWTNQITTTISNLMCN